MEMLKWEIQRPLTNAKYRTICETKRWAPATCIDWIMKNLRECIYAAFK
jgi:hypothetical protein